MTSPRVIITARYLAETFSHLGAELLILTLSPFCANDFEKAIKYFDARIKEVEEMPAKPGKQGTIEAWQHLKSAYEKMSPVERKRVADELPNEIAKVLKDA